MQNLICVEKVIHHLRRDSKQFFEDNTKTFCGIKIIPLEGFHGLQLPANVDILSRIFYLRATSQTKTIKDKVNDVNDKLEVIYQKGLFKMKKRFQTKKV